MKILVGMLLSYLLGTISGSYILSKALYKDDIRAHGSGNAGTTNALRTRGKVFGFATFLIDFFKGFFAVYLGRKYFSSDYFVLFGLCSVIGHIYPLFMDFRGGKGAATACGVFFAISLPIGIITNVLSFFIAIVTDKASVGSMAFCLLNLFCFAMLKTITPINLLFVGLICVFIIFKHKDNIARIKAGTESSLGGLLWNKKK